jgi:hypothetical protein
MSEFLNPHITRPAIRWTSGDALPAIEQTGQAAPLLIDSTTGRLLVDTEANLTADLSDIEAKQDTTNGILATQAADTALIKASAASIAGLSIPANDYISLSYTGANLTTVVYKSGGSGGTTVATLTLAYSGSDLISVTKS